MKSDATADDFEIFKIVVWFDDFSWNSYTKTSDAKEKKQNGLYAGGFDLWSGDFEEHNGSFFLKGISRTLPQMLIGMRAVIAK
jgi:hypothetical protein